MSDVRHVKLIEDIDRDAWDTLVPGSCFYQSHGWLRGQQRSEVATAAYTCVESDGALVAATPTYEFQAENAPPLPTIAEDQDVLRVGTRTGYHNEILLAEAGPGGTAETSDRLADLILGTAEFAAVRGHEALLFDFLTTDSLRLIAGLFKVRAQLRSAEAIVRNDEGTFESYRKSLGRKFRTCEQEMRRFESSGLRMETARLSRCIDEIAPLIGQTMDRYDASLHLSDIRGYLNEQARCLDGQSVVFRCIDEADQLIGGSVCFAWRDTFYGRVAGFDYTRTRNAFEYFNACYYGPIRHMERNGLTTLHLGLSALEAKVRRGATLHPVWAAVLDLPLTEGAGISRDTAADATLAGELQREAGGGMALEAWDLSGLSPL